MNQGTKDSYLTTRPFLYNLVLSVKVDEKKGHDSKKKSVIQVGSVWTYVERSPTNFDHTVDHLDPQ